MQYEGKIIYIWEVETVGANWLQKRTVVLEELNDKEFKGSLAFDLMKDKTSYIDKYSVGDTVTVHLNLRANYSENSKRYYQSISCWRIEGNATKKEETVEEIMPF